MDTQKKLLKNWTDSSTRYTNIIRNELASFKKDAWKKLIKANIGKAGSLDVLDVGTGPGFFSILMAELGHRVTAIDCTEAMLEEAVKNIVVAGMEQQVKLKLADAQEPDFPEESFDLIISRNVTWTLMDAEKAYASWYDLLRKGGRVLIFDANWNRRLFDSEYQRKYVEDQQEAIRRFGSADEHPYTPEMLDYRHSMPMCRRIRPQWDFQALLKAGFSKIMCDITVGPLIYDEKEQLINRSTPMFLLVAEK